MSGYGFDAAEKMFGGSGGAGISQHLAKLKDGETIDVVFLGEPYARRQVWVDGDKGRYPVAYDPKVHDFKESRATCYMCILVLSQSGEHEVKIWPGNYYFFQDLKTAHEEYGFGWRFKIRRTGSDQRTRYHILPQKELTDDQRQKLSGYEPLDIEALLTRDAAEHGDEPPAESYRNEDFGGVVADDDIPFMRVNDDLW